MSSVTPSIWCVATGQHGTLEFHRLILSFHLSLPSLLPPSIYPLLLSSSLSTYTLHIFIRNYDLENTLLL